MRIFLLIFLFPFVVFSQNNYPDSVYVSPLNIDLLLSGSFGELRNNHFHSGLDIRTQYKEGLNVYAANDGYVSRIKISTYGYGKAIYIDHPDGYTTVYGHLQNATGKINEYLKKAQYDQKKYEIELFPSPNELVVKKGDLIALSGNTGGSGGPHLHFEFRDTNTEKIINPMFFGMNKKITDTRAPVLAGIVAYPISENAVVNASQKPIELNFTKQSDGTYLASKVAANGMIGFGINTYDLSDKNYGKNGVYKIKTCTNGKKSFEIIFDTFSFDEGRYINNYVDYERMKRTNEKIQKLFVKKKYPLELIHLGSNNGILTLKPNTQINYKIEVEDFHKNKYEINIPITYSAALPTIFKEEVKTNYLLKSAIENIYEKENVTVIVPENTFYDDFYLDFEVKEKVLNFHNKYLSPHKNYTIKFEDDSFSDTEKKKVFIANIIGRRVDYNKTYNKGNVFTTYTKDMGEFKLMTDNVAPTVVPINFSEGKWISSLKELVLKIDDDASGIDSYNGFLNEKWVLFEYDYKTNKITHEIDESFVIDGRNVLKVVVIDNVGNSTIFETHFFRSKK